MTFTTKIKDEITKLDENIIESLVTLHTYLYYNAEINYDNIMILTENASVARYIFKLFKTHYNISIRLTVRVQKKFKIKNIYILTIKEKVNLIKDDIKNTILNIKESSLEEQVAFLKGVFLATGSVNDPSKSKYHLEFLIDKEKKKITNLSILAKSQKQSVIIKQSANSGIVISGLLCFSFFQYLKHFVSYANSLNSHNNSNTCLLNISSLL